MTTPRSIITIADLVRLPNVMQACEPAEISDFRGSAILTKAMQDALEAKLPAVANKSHALAAYLAANQIGFNKRVVLLYLPPTKRPAELIVMNNPRYQMMTAYPDTAKPQFRISTFMAEQFRFRNDCYAQKILVDYYDKNWSNRSLILEDHAAIAAQMGINFINGITPLDHNISQQELLAFANSQEQVFSGKERIILTRKAYEYHGRHAEIDTKKFEFGNTQAAHISGFLKLRDSFKILHNPRTGRLLTEEQSPVIERKAKPSMTL